jgi:exonuclease I
MASKTQQLTPTWGLAIDWETSGADFGKDSSINYQGLSFGAVVFKTSNFEIVEELYLEIKFDETKYKWTEGAAKIHGLTREHLEANGITQEEAAIQLGELIFKYFGDGKVMFLGHNPEFDRRFTNQLLNTVEIEFSVEKQTKFESWIQLHHVVLDTSALGFITLGLFKSDLLFEKIGFEERGAHNALADIKMTLETCKTIRALVEIALNG